MDIFYNPRTKEPSICKYGNYEGDGGGGGGILKLSPSAWGGAGINKINSRG